VSKHDFPGYDPIFFRVGLSGVTHRREDQDPAHLPCCELCSTLRVFCSSYDGQC